MRAARPSIPASRASLRIRARLLVSFLGLAAGLIFALTILMERSARRSLDHELAVRLESIAAAATTQIDPSLVGAVLSIGADGAQRTRERLAGRLIRLRDVTDVRRIYIPVSYTHLTLPTN